MCSLQSEIRPPATWKRAKKACAKTMLHLSEWTRTYSPTLTQEGHLGLLGCRPHSRLSIGHSNEQTSSKSIFSRMQQLADIPWQARGQREAFELGMVGEKSRSQARRAIAQILEPAPNTPETCMHRHGLMTQGSRSNKPLVLTAQMNVRRLLPCLKPSIVRRVGFEKQKEKLSLPAGKLQKTDHKIRPP